MKKKNNIMLFVCYLLLSIMFIIQGLKQHGNFIRIAYFLISIGLIIGSSGFIIEGLKQGKKKID